jgi:monovalent cation/hydrogen antiporter
MGSEPVANLLRAAVAVSAAVIVARIVWVFPSAYLPRLIPRIRAADPFPPWQYPAAVAWAGMRGVVSLAAAVALPFTTLTGAPFPQRDTIQFLAFCVILVTLVLQGLSLPAVVRWLGLDGRDSGPDGREEATARYRTATVALARLDELVARQAVPEAVEHKLRRRLEERQRWSAKRLDGDGQMATRVQAVHANYAQVRRALLRVERAEAVRLLEEGTISSDALHRFQRELDLEESQLTKE